MTLASMRQDTFDGKGDAARNGVGYRGGEYLVSFSLEFLTKALQLVLMLQ